MHLILSKLTQRSLRLSSILFILFPLFYSSGVIYTILPSSSFIHSSASVISVIGSLSIQFSSAAHLCPSLCDPMDCSIPGLPVHHQLLCLLKLISIESLMASNHLILCCPLLLPPSFFLSIRVFSNESALRIQWLKYWSFSFNISPSSAYSGVTSFRMDWLDLLAVQGTLKSLLQHHTSKASVLCHSAFFIVQLSHPYMTTGKTIALTRLNLCGQGNISAF